MHGQTIAQTIAKVMLGPLHRAAKERGQTMATIAITPGEIYDASAFVNAGQWNMKDAYTYFCILLHEPLRR